MILSDNSSSDFVFYFFALVVILFGEAEQSNKQCGKGPKLIKKSISALVAILFGRAKSFANGHFWYRTVWELFQRSF